MKSHRETYPEQYTNPLCGKRVIVGTGEKAFEAVFERTVQTRFGTLAIMEGSTDGWLLSAVKEKK